MRMWTTSAGQGLSPKNWESKRFSCLRKTSRFIKAVKTPFFRFFLRRNDPALRYAQRRGAQAPAGFEQARLLFRYNQRSLPPTVWPPEYPDFKVISTPGHTRGGVCYWFESLNALFSGDTLFSGSIGRTDLPGGDFDTIMTSIREKLLTLPENLRIFPGHGEESTIGIEKSFNPYLR